MAIKELTAEELALVAGGGDIQNGRQETPPPTPYGDMQNG